MKSPDDVKKGLRCLSHDRTHTLPCSDCEYHGQGLPPCRTAVHEDAIALIQRLEAQNAEKDARIQQLEKRVIHLEALNQSNLSVITMQERTRDRLQEQISRLEADKQQFEGMLSHMNQLRDAAAGRALKMEERAHQLEAERDALYEEVRRCFYCIYVEGVLGECDQCCESCEADCPCKECDHYNKFEWRGVQKEE